jgi:hypothetical protein
LLLVLLLKDAPTMLYSATIALVSFLSLLIPFSVNDYTQCGPFWFTSQTTGSEIIDTDAASRCHFTPVQPASGPGLCTVCLAIGPSCTLTPSHPRLTPLTCPREKHQVEVNLRFVMRLRRSLQATKKWHRVADRSWLAPRMNIADFSCFSLPYSLLLHDSRRCRSLLFAFQSLVQYAFLITLSEVEHHTRFCFGFAFCFCFCANYLLRFGH